MTNVPPDLEARRATLDSLAKKNGDLARIVRRTDRNGQPVPPTPDDAWTAQVRAATPQAQVAIAAGARARAERAEARVAALEAELAAAVDVAEPDPRASFAEKNRALFAAVLAADENGRLTTDTNTQEQNP